MNKFKIIIVSVLACVIALGGGFVLAQVAGLFPSETNPFGSNYYIEKTNQEKPFFTAILPEIRENIAENNKNSISKYYDELPLANNPENFQGLGSTSYANINGKTVTAEAFYRVKGDSLCDPNAGMGLLIYQCIQYKLKHPDEDVEIAFSTYRTSATASVCVLPESRYYGYMRSLYTTNYDEHGFVRISYMMVEAARMGIKVTLLNQLESYSVQQYNPTTDKLENRKEIDYKTYFKKAADMDCYDSFANGKKVSDFLNCITVDWTVLEQTPNMQHLKTCTVSHYLATDGEEHKYGVFLTTSNLDENDYLGRNGNSYSQTGVILSEHAEIYRVTMNYFNLMTKYTNKEGIQEMRRVIIDRNVAQRDLILAGKEEEIPADEQIMYLGSENDPVFKMYFTPIAGGVDAWDPVNNPICAYVDKLTDSTDYIEFAWNEYGTETNFLNKTLSEKLVKAFCENPNAKNKISIKANGVSLDAVKKLKIGTQIGYRSIKGNSGQHAKDFMFSYVEDDTRHDVTILTSSNFIVQGFHHRTNSILVIDETAATGGNFYEILGQKYADGMIKNN